MLQITAEGSGDQYTTCSSDDNRAKNLVCSVVYTSFDSDNSNCATGSQNYIDQGQPTIRIIIIQIFLIESRLDYFILNAAVLVLVPDKKIERTGAGV